MARDAGGRSDTDSDADAERSADGSAPPKGSPDSQGDTESAPDGQRRDVIVPLAIYKRVTVVSTVLASALVVMGFLLLDAATEQTRLLRSPIEAGLTWLGVGLSAGSLSVVLALAGLSVIVAGAAIYVFGARFRTVGMGSDKTDPGEDADNG